MTQVSKIKLNPEVESRIYNLLEYSLIRFKSKNEIIDFLDDFLSPIEKIILAKRVAIAALLAKGRNYAGISRILRVTPNTITKMSLKVKYGNGSVRSLAEKIANSDLGKALVEDLFGIFQPSKYTPSGDKYKKSEQEREKKLRRLRTEI